MLYSRRRHRARWWGVSCGVLAMISLFATDKTHAGSVATSTLDLAIFSFTLPTLDQSVEFGGYAATFNGGLRGMKGSFGEPDFVPDPEWQERPPLGELSEQFGPLDPLDPTKPYSVALSNGPVQAIAIPPPTYSFFSTDAQGFLTFRNYDLSQSVTITVNWGAIWTLDAKGATSVATIHMDYYNEDDSGTVTSKGVLVDQTIHNDNHVPGGAGPGMGGGAISITLLPAESYIDGNGVEQIIPSVDFFAAEVRNDATASVPEPSSLALLAAGGAALAGYQLLSRSKVKYRRRPVRVG